MHVFQIKGFSSILLLLLAIIAAFLVIIALPTAFMMVLWNATIYESFQLGPEISLYQGFLLWSLFLIVFKLVFNPEIQFQIQKQGKDDQAALKKERTGKEKRTSSKRK